MTRLVIAASPLLERWSITSSVRRDRITWPPSPDTLFSALVAAAASLGQARHPALYWLEAQGNPAIETDLEPPHVEGIVCFEPVADRSLFEGRSRQARWHNSVGHPGSVAWSWEVTETEHVEALKRIATEVTYIGSSRAPVIATAELRSTPLPDGALIPIDVGEYRLRGLYVGRLDELESDFHAGRRPRPTETVGYGLLGEERLLSPWGQMIPLRRVIGQYLDISKAVPICEAVRRALTCHLPDDAPGMLTGHTADGRTLAGEHLAILPLAHVDEHGQDRYADGNVLGVGLLLPASCSDDDYNLLIIGLQRWLAAGGTVEIGRNRWTMEVASNDHRRSLRADRLAGVSRTWATATPVVCDRHARRDLRLEDVVGSMCRDAGLPAPREVVAMPYSPVGGGVDCRRHSLGGRAYLACKFVTHLRLTWPRPMPGPLLIGRGRYFGMGLLLPQAGT